MQIRRACVQWSACGTYARRSVHVRVSGVRARGRHGDRDVVLGRRVRVLAPVAAARPAPLAGSAYTDRSAQRSQI